MKKIPHRQVTLRPHMQPLPQMPPPPHGRRWEGQVPGGAGRAWTLHTFLRPSWSRHGAAPPPLCARVRPRVPTPGTERVPRGAATPPLPPGRAAPWLPPGGQGSSGPAPLPHKCSRQERAAGEGRGRGREGAPPPASPRAAAGTLRGCREGTAGGRAAWAAAPQRPGSAPRHRLAESGAPAPLAAAAATPGPRP